jgi:hypothetical protein
LITSGHTQPLAHMLKLNSFIMKKIKKILITILFFDLFFIILSGCNDCGTQSIWSIKIERIDNNILDSRLVYLLNYSSGYKEKNCLINGNDIDTKTIQYSINKKIILFNDTILPNDNLWLNPETNKYIKYNKSSYYSELIFDNNFYENSLIDTVGLIIVFKAKTTDTTQLMAKYEQ